MCYDRTTGVFSPSHFPSFAGRSEVLRGAAGPPVFALHSCYASGWAVSSPSMHLFAPDILNEARGLSFGVCATVIVLGLLLWLFGWRWHRFWTVLCATIAGAVYGLSTGDVGDAQVITLAVLLALAAGVLALEVVRLFAFAAGGTAVWLAIGSMAPNAQVTNIAFLAGGLVGVLFYRLWTMIATSFLGALLAGYGGLVLAESQLPFDAADWANRNSLSLSLAIGAATILGLAVQAVQSRRQYYREHDWRRRRYRKYRPLAADGHDLPPDLRALRESFRRRAI